MAAKHGRIPGGWVTEWRPDKSGTKVYVHRLDPKNPFPKIWAEVHCAPDATGIDWFYLIYCQAEQDPIIVEPMFSTVEQAMADADKWLEQWQ